MPGYLCILFDGSAMAVGTGLIEAEGIEIAIQNAKERCSNLPDDTSFALWESGKLIYRSAPLKVVPALTGT